MKMKWDPTDFLECLEVEPSVDKDGVEHTYEVIKNGLKLLISVFQHDGDVYFSLMREKQTKSSIVTLKINQCLQIVLKKFEKVEYLEFLPGRQTLQSFDKQSSITKGVRVRIHPDIKLELYEP